MSQIQTRWQAQASAGETLREYPRPQLERAQWLCLNGRYDYAVTGEGADFPARFDGEILVPFALESALSGVQKPLLPTQRLWYRRLFTLPEDFAGQRILLHFGAVDWQCQVYVNRKSVGEHTGGYLPFSLDITDAFTEGENELMVRVFDPTDTAGQQRGKQVRDPKGIWYTATSGIWQTVWLEPVAPCHIRSIRLLPNIERGILQLETRLSEKKDVQILAILSDGGSEISRGEIGLQAELAVPNAKLWSPETPHLYDLTLEVRKGGVLCDRVKSYFGMRSFGIGKDSAGLPRLLLNGKPYFQKGLLDQGYWPESGLTPPSDEAMIYDIERMKTLGFNMLRKHIKVEPLRWYYHCDRLGMLVWQDMPSGGQYIGNLLAGVLPTAGIPVRDHHYNWFKRSEKTERMQFRQELFTMLETLYNCVGISCWVPFNEAWGQFDAREIGSAVKEFDPSRVVDHASGWYDQGGPDLKSVHRYILPVRLPPKDSRPFVLSEYGGYSLILSGHVWDEERSFGYRMDKSREALSARYRALHEKQIFPLIPKGLSATVYTQLSDVELEVNGILSYDRELLKLDADMLREVNGKMVL